MAKVPIHFIGFLANVDDSIARIRLGDGFVIESGPSSDVVPFLGQIESHWGMRARDGTVPEGRQRVVNHNVVQMENLPQARAAIPLQALNSAYLYVRDKLRLLRLFKEGNVILAYSFFYPVDEAGPDVLSSVREYPIADRTLFALSPGEVADAQSFLDTVSLPLPEPLDLAFKSFESSHETYDIGLSFLSLMIAMEVVLHPGNRDELRYRISRNAGVLLGQNRVDAERVYKAVRELYDKRSKLVHTGDKSHVTREDVLTLRHFVREAIKEMKAGVSKDAFLNILNSCGFGERPWRAE